MQNDFTMFIIKIHCLIIHKSIPFNEIFFNILSRFHHLLAEFMNKETTVERNFLFEATLSEVKHSNRKFSNLISFGLFTREEQVAVYSLKNFQVAKKYFFVVSFEFIIINTKEDGKKTRSSNN